MWKILYQSPSRRADYEKVTNSTTYPLQFCSHRLVENKNVAIRAESIWGNYVKLTKHWKTLPKSKQRDNNSFGTLQEAVDNPLMKAKFKVFEMIARHFNSFLVSYQTDDSMILLLSNGFTLLYRNLLSLFIRKAVLIDPTSLIKLSKINPLSNVNQKRACDVEIGFGAREVVIEGKSKGLVSLTKLLAFKKEFRAFLATVCQHIMEKSPLKSKLAGNIFFINPKMMATDSSIQEVFCNPGNAGAVIENFSKGCR